MRYHWRICDDVQSRQGKLSHRPDQVNKSAQKRPFARAIVGVDNTEYRAEYCALTVSVGEPYGRNETATDSPSHPTFSWPAVAVSVLCRAPQLPPPWIGMFIRVEPDPFEHAREVPSGQVGERRGVGSMSALDLCEVVARGRTGIGRSGPGMTDHVARLEVFLILGLLEDQVLGKSRGRVAHMQTSKNHLHRAARRNREDLRIRHWHWLRSALRFVVEPEDAELAQLFGA